MKKYVIVSAFVIMQTASIVVARPLRDVQLIASPQLDSLDEYTGKYQMQQGTETVTADVYIENGKLTTKSSDGGILTLDHISGDNFVISGQGTEIKFIRDKQNKVMQVAVMGNIAWTRVDAKIQSTQNMKPASLPDYAGKYQAAANGHTLIIEVTVKNGQLWATQLWDNASSALDFVSADSFSVNALSISLKFTRDGSKKVTQLVLNGKDVFTKVK